MSSGKTLSQVHIITPSFPPHKSSSPSSRKGGGNYVNLQMLVKFSQPGLILDIGPFWFCSTLSYKSFNTVLCLERFHPQFALYLLIYILFNSYHIHAMPP